MESVKNKDCFEIGFKINFRNSLSTKDFVEILDLINKSYSDVLNFTDFNKRNKYDYFRINDIKSGSIDFETIINAIANLITVGTFIYEFAKKIKERISSKSEKVNNSRSHYNVDVYVRNATKVTIDHNKIIIDINNSNDGEIEPINIKFCDKK